MSEQVVKRYSLSEFAEQHTHPVGPGTYVEATDYDALHAEAEALRAELSRRDALDADGLEFRKELIKQRDDARTELEAARGLLANMVASLLDHESAECNLIQRARAFLTATPAPEVQAETLDDRLKQAGMLSVAELLKGAPLDAFIRHAGVHDLSTLLQWAEMRRGECLRMMARYDLGEKDKGDDLYEWIVAHCAVFTELHVNLRAALAEQGERQEAVHWRARLHPDQRPQQLHDKHVVGFTTRESAEAWVAEKKDFQGWDYSIEPLYTTPQPGPDVRALVEALNYACKSLSQITSSDGSGHADIALSVLRMAGVDAEERERLVDGWKASCQWRIDKAHRQAQQGGSHDC